MRPRQISNIDFIIDEYESCGMTNREALVATQKLIDPHVRELWGMTSKQREEKYWELEMELKTKNLYVDKSP